MRRAARRKARRVAMRKGRRRESASYTSRTLSIDTPAINMFVLNLSTAPQP